MILKLNMLVFTAVSAYMDLKWWKVKNYWLLAGTAAGVVFNLFSEESPGIPSALGGILIPLLMLGWLHRLGKMGAGDIKLFMVCGLFLGTGKILMFMLTAMICGAVRFVYPAIKQRSVKAVLNRKIHVAVCAFASTLCLIGGVYG